MKKLMMLLIMMSMFMIISVSADDNSQNAMGIISGDNNVMVNDNDNYQYENDQHATSNVNGIGNSVTTSNTNVAGDVVNGATTVVNDNNQIVVLPPGTSHAKLNYDDLFLDTQIISIYEGEVYVANNDYDYVNGNIQRKGEVYKYTIHSAYPVFAYVINAVDDKKVETKSGAPKYDVIYHKLEPNWVDVVYKNTHPSPNQQFTVTIPEDGRYSLVIDTRMMNTFDGIQSEINPNTIDIYYSIHKISNATPQSYKKPVIGERSMFEILADGSINPGKTITL